MRRVLTCLAGLAAALAAAGAARAGVYISGKEPPDVRAFDSIRKLRQDLQVAANPAAGGRDAREEYLRLAEALEAREREGGLSVLERADLGGCYVRLGRPGDAIRVLAADDTGHFLVQANLAVAYQGDGQPGRAVAAQRRALDNWPPAWPAWSDAQWYFYRRVEYYQLALLESRLKEQAQAEARPRGAGPPPAFQSVDPLFPGVRFVGPGGEYAAGRIALDMLDRLPPDAPWVVRNLIWTFPNDDRLYWLFGELLNSRAEVENAYEVMRELVDARQRSNVRELFRHRQVLRERVEELHELRKADMFKNPALPPLAQEQLLWAVAPRPPLAVPGAGPLAWEGAWSATAAYLELAQREELAGRRPEDQVAPPPPPPPESAAAPPPSALLNWRQITVAVVAGLVVATLARLQWGEWRRRRPAA
jgi:hypothetical protein